MQRSIALIFVLAGMLLWIVAMAIALHVDTEWLTDRLPAIDPLMVGIVAAITCSALLVAWRVFRPRTVRRYRNRRN